MRQNVYFVMIKTTIQQNDIILKMYAPNNTPTLYKEKLKKKWEEKYKFRHTTVRLQ